MTLFQVGRSHEKTPLGVERIQIPLKNLRWSVISLDVFKPASRLIDILFCLLVLSLLVLVRNFEALRVALVAFLNCSVCSVMLSCAANAVVKVCIIMTSWCPDRL